MARHISRLRRGGAVPDSPLFPNDQGQVGLVATSFQMAIQAAGIPIHAGRRGTPDGQVQGPCSQSLGSTISRGQRHPSRTAERYVQTAPLRRAHLVPNQALMTTGRRHARSPTRLRCQGPPPSWRRGQRQGRQLARSHRQQMACRMYSTSLPMDRAVGTSPTVYILHTRTKRVHQPDEAEDAKESYA